MSVVFLFSAERMNISAVKENSKDARLDLLENEPELMRNFVRSLFPVLYEVYSASAGPAIRHECLRSILRMVYHSDSNLLNDVLKNLTVSRYYIKGLYV